MGLGIVSEPIETDICGGFITLSFVVHGNLDKYYRDTVEASKGGVGVGSGHTRGQSGQCSLLLTQSTWPHKPGGDRIYGAKPDQRYVRQVS